MATTVSVESTPGGGSYVDLTAYLIRNTATLTVNTLTFTLNNPPPTSNLLTLNQASLESGTTGWTSEINCTLASSATVALDGTKSLSMTAVAASLMRARTGEAPATLVVAPNATYTAMAWIQAGSVLRNCTIYVRWWKADQSASAHSFDSMVSANDAVGSWTKLSGSVTSPSDAAYASIVIDIASPGAGEIHYVDQISLAFGSSATWEPGGLAPSSARLGAGATLTDPAWSGTVASVMSSDPKDLRNGIEYVSVTATNSTVAVANSAPFDLSDVPTTTPLDTYQLEDGTLYELESGTDFAPGNYELEGALSYGYDGLSVRVSVNSTAGGPPQTLGRANLWQPGMRPGNIFNLTSLNQGYTAAPFQVTQVTITWPAPTQPRYVIQFGDTPQTLAAWAQANAPVAVPEAVPPAPAFVPSGPVTYGQVKAGTGIFTMGGGIVTIATATFSVSPAAGRSLTCQVLGAIDARMEAWDNYVAAPRRGVRALLSGGIFTGSWQELPFGLTRAVYDLSSSSGIALPSGSYTVSLQINTVEYNQMHVYSGWVQVAVTTV